MKWYWWAAGAAGLGALAVAASGKETGPGLVGAPPHKYDRMVALALDLGDQKAFEAALTEAARRGDNRTGRLLLARFDRAGVDAAVPILPRNQEPITYRGIQLNWDPGVARLFAVCVALRVLPLFEAHYPGDNRLRRALGVARMYARGEATEGDLRAALVSAQAAYRLAYMDPPPANAGPYDADVASYSAVMAAEAATHALSESVLHAPFEAADAQANYDVDFRDAVYAEASVKERDQQHQIFVQFLLGEVEDVPCEVST